MAVSAMLLMRGIGWCCAVLLPLFGVFAFIWPGITLAALALCVGRLRYRRWCDGADRCVHDARGRQTAVGAHRGRYSQSKAA